ncbi:hypothetical protein QQZ08_006868 [Neonectria magnoliae]|uniref:Major facilitator superfamily (MFS) profile domain-containing protein n=1 Tax=Neonectria magnoliae TaxID=2732573 RepID=A0ABR1HZH1_9HYPO
MAPKQETLAIGSGSHHIGYSHGGLKAGGTFVGGSPPGLFLNPCVVATAIGGMLFGYDTGVISGALAVLGTDLHGRLLTHAEKELITALCAGGALLGAIIAGVRLTTLDQATSYSIGQMCIGRVLVGLGVGSASIIILLYIAEIAPVKYSGRMISIDMVFLGTGSLLAYGFDAAFYNVDHGWRYMAGLGGIHSIMLGI